MSAPGSNGGQLLALVERIERLEEDKREIAEDVKSVYGEAKSNGFAPAIIRKIVAARRKAADARAEENELLRLYAAELGQTDLFA